MILVVSCKRNNFFSSKSLKKNIYIYISQHIIIVKVDSHLLPMWGLEDFCLCRVGAPLPAIDIAEVPMEEEEIALPPDQADGGLLGALKGTERSLSVLPTKKKK